MSIIYALKEISKYHLQRCETYKTTHNRNALDKVVVIQAKVGQNAANGIGVVYNEPRNKVLHWRVSPKSKHNQRSERVLNIKELHIIQIRDYNNYRF